MRLKKWQAITLGAFAVLDFAVLGIGLAIVLKSTKPQATSTISQADSDYMLDYRVCEKLRYFPIFRDLMNLLDATKTSTITTDTCNTLLANTLPALEDAKVCAVKTHIPEDYDLREHRQHMLAFLESAQSMWGQVEAACRTGKQGPQLQELLDRTGIELGNVNSSMGNYINKHPNSTTTVPNPTTIAVAINQTLTALPELTATPIAAIHMQTVQPPKPTNTPPPIKTPSSYKTATPVAKFGSDNDIGYFQDLYPCLAPDEAASKAMKDLTYAIQTRAILDRDTCLVAVVGAIATLDKSKSCRQNTRIPDDYDLRSARQYRLDGLETERSALVLFGRTCGTGTADPDAETLFSRSLEQFEGEESALKRFFDRYPEIKKLVDKINER